MQLIYDNNIFFTSAKINRRNGPVGHKELAFSHNSLITDLMAKNDDREVDS